MTFHAALRDRWAHGSLVCVGLDPDPGQIPRAVTGTDAQRTEIFSREIVDATAEFACAFKLNTAFYERLGPAGAVALEQTVRFIKDQHPSCVVIVDGKRGDINHTNRYYASALFDTLGADAVTVHPYLGRQSLLPFLERGDKGVIVMGANSDDGAREFQDLAVGPSQAPLYEHVCRAVAQEWNTKLNCSVTAGANEPDKLARIRQVVGDLPILLLGLGAQGGDVGECLRVGRAGADFGLIANSSRQIIYSSHGSDFAESAHRAAGAFNRALHLPARPPTR